MADSRVESKQPDSTSLWTVRSIVPWREWGSLPRGMAVAAALLGIAAFLPLFISSNDYLWVLVLVLTGYAASFAGGVTIGAIGGLFIVGFPLLVGALAGIPPDLAGNLGLVVTALVAFPLFGASVGFVSALVISHKRASAEIRHLRSILPICAYCKRIRDDEGFWTAVEEYFSRHSDIMFSHGLCDDCLHLHFPEHAESVIAERKRQR